jgi:hypothetical protein
VYYTDRRRALWYLKGMRLKLRRDDRSKEILNADDDGVSSPDISLRLYIYEFLLNTKSFLLLER